MEIATADSSPAGLPPTVFGGRSRPADSLRSRAIQYGIAALTLVLVLSPTVPIVYQSLIDRPIYDGGHALTLKNYTDFASSRLFGSAIVNTLILAVGATFVGQVIGVACAILLGRTDIPGRRISAVC